MKIARSIRLRLRNMRRTLLDRDLRDEYHFHVEMSTHGYIDSGMDPQKARERSLKEFGNRTALRERSREMFTFTRIETWLKDVLHGVRVLRKNPGYSVAAVVILATGIGASVAIFSVVYGVLLRPLPYSGGERLVVLHQEAPVAGLRDVPFSTQEIFDYRNMTQTLDALVEHHSMNFLLLTGDRAERVDTAVVSANFFEVLGVRPLLGRTFVAADDLPDSEAVIVLSHEYWQGRHGGDPGIVGTVFEMNDRPHRVIGVLPPIPQYPVENEVYMPTSHCPTRSSPAFVANRQARMMTAFGRLDPDANLTATQAELSNVAASLRNSYPEAYPESRGYGMRVTPLKQDLTSRAQPTFLLLLGAAGLVLLIACANVANLLLARLMKLSRELSLRMALGASRTRLIRQLLTENILLSLTAGVLGTLVALTAHRLLVDFAARFTTRASEIQLDAPVLLFALVLSLGVGVLFAFGPALTSSHGAGEALKQAGGRSTISRKGRRARNGLVVAQVAVSFMLLVSAGLMTRSLVRLQQVDPGFDTDRILSMRLSPNYSRIPDMDQLMADLNRAADQLLSEVGSITGVEEVALTNGFPFRPEGLASGPDAVGLEVVGRPQNGLERTVDLDTVSLAYFDLIGQPLLAGRTFTRLDDATAMPVAVINEAMADNWFEGENPLGRMIRAPRMGVTAEIVGVVQNVREYGLDQPSVDKIYVPMEQFGFVQNLLVRTSIPAMGVFPTVRATLLEIDSQLAVDQVTTIETLREESLASPRLTTALLNLFAFAALVISSGGIAAVMALVVSQRTNELGIRMTLGASRRSVLGLILGQGLRLVVAGIILGGLAAAASSRLLASALYDTAPMEATTLAMVAVLFVAVTAVACLVPARRATAVDPNAALRCD